MSGSFELKGNEAGQYSFTLKAADGSVLLRSEQYDARASAENGIASVQKNAASPERYDLKVASDGRFYFNLKAGNHQVIGTSRMYATEAERELDIAAVQAVAPTAGVAG
jgi:uncharacterized protein